MLEMCDRLWSYVGIFGIFLIPLTVGEKKGCLLCSRTKVLMRLLFSVELHFLYLLFSFTLGRSCLGSLDLRKISKYLSQFQTQYQDLPLRSTVWNWAPRLLVLRFQNWQSKYLDRVFGDCVISSCCAGCSCLSLDNSLLGFLLLLLTFPLSSPTFIPFQLK